jgi:hypothetical protein
MRKRITKVAAAIGLAAGLVVIGGSVVGGVALALDRGQPPAAPASVSDSTADGHDVVVDPSDDQGADEQGSDEQGGTSPGGDRSSDDGSTTDADDCDDGTDDDATEAADSSCPAPVDEPEDDHEPGDD